MNCDVCGKKIEVMCFKGTGVCSINCEKIRAAGMDELAPAEIEEVVSVN